MAVFSIILTVAMLGGCAISRTTEKEPRYDKVIKHNVLEPGDLFKPSKAAKKARSGYVVIRSQNDLKKLIDKNTIYCIKNELNLQGKTLTIPSGCLLFFDGGSFRNGTIRGNNTIVVAEDYEIFKHGISTYRAYKSDAYKYVTKHQDAIIIDGTWKNLACGGQWTGMCDQTSNHCASLALNNFIRLHAKGQEIIFPGNKEYYVYDRIICSGYSIDFNNSVIWSIDFNIVEDRTISLPRGAQPRTLKSLYGLIEFSGDNAFLKNLTIDGKASQRNEVPSFGTECLISMASNTNCLLENVQLVDAVGCGICTYAISDCTFNKVTFNGCGEHGFYTHAYKGALRLNNCRFVDCGQEPSLFKQRGASACVKFSGSRDLSYAALKDLKAYFTDCTFESTAPNYVATFYSDIPYAEFERCKWVGNVKGYSIVSSSLAEQIGKLVEFKFVECDNPCYSIQSSNTIRRLIRCTNVSNPFADAIELTDCEINVGYADVENNYSPMFAEQYQIPIVCSNCKFVKGSDDVSIRNTIGKPRPMVFDHCKWVFADSQAKVYKGSYYIVLSERDNNTLENFVTFTSCDIDIDQYRMLYCSNTDIFFDRCDYVSSYDTLVESQQNNPNRIKVKQMNNIGNRRVSNRSIIIE